MRTKRVDGTTDRQIRRGVRKPKQNERTGPAVCQAVWIERDLAMLSSCPTESHSWGSTAFSLWPSMFTLRGPASIDQLPQWLRSSNTWLKLQSRYKIKCFSLAQTRPDKRDGLNTLSVYRRPFVCISSFHSFSFFIFLLHLPVYCPRVCIKGSHISEFILVFFSSLLFVFPASFPPIPSLNRVKAISITVKLYTPVEITPAVSSNEWLDIIERACLVSSPCRHNPPASWRKGDNWQTYNPLPPHGTPENHRGDKVMTWRKVSNPIVGKQQGKAGV